MIPGVGFESAPSVSLSRGKRDKTAGPVKSERSDAPRSLKTDSPSPGGATTLGSSVRKAPVMSIAGAMIGDGANPSGCLTASSAARSTKESIDESMAADPGTG